MPKGEARTAVNANYLAQQFGDVITKAMQDAAFSLQSEGNKASVTIKVEFSLDKDEKQKMKVRVAKSTSAYESEGVTYFRKEGSNVMYVQQEMDLQNAANE